MQVIRLTLKHYVEEIANSAFSKSIISFFISFTSVTFQEGDSMVLIGLLLLVIMDCITGVLGAHRAGIPVTSKKLGMTISKIFVYFTLIVAFKLSDMILGRPFGFELATFCTGWMALTELYSIMENSEKLGFPLPNKIVRLIKGKILEYNEDIKK